MSTWSSLTDNGAPAPDLLEVGRIGKAHGLKGEVSVRLISDRLAQPQSWILSPEANRFALALHVDQFFLLRQFDNGRRHPVEGGARHRLIGLVAADRGDERRVEAAAEQDDIIFSHQLSQRVDSGLQIIAAMNRVSMPKSGR